MRAREYEGKGYEGKGMGWRNVGPGETGKQERTRIVVFIPLPSHSLAQSPCHVL